MMHIKNKKIIQKGDKVKMNNKYYVPEEDRGKVFTVKTEPQTVCGILCVLLEETAGCFAVDGLELVR